MLSTYLYNFKTDTEIYNASASGIYDAIWGLITWYPDMSEVEKIERLDIESGEKKLIKPEIVKAINIDIISQENNETITRGLRNVGGFSCFMDALLLPLLTVDGYFKDNLLNKKTDCPEIEKSLKQIYNSIVENNKDSSCIPLISAMKRCEKVKNLVTGAQQDDSEFLIGLMDLYKLEPTTVNHVRFLSDNKKKWIKIDDSTTKESVLEIVITDSAEPLDLYQKASFDDFSENDEDERPLDEKTGKRMKYSYSVDRVVSSQALVLHTQRRLERRKNRTAIDISKAIRDQLEDIYYILRIITVHHGSESSGHYTSYFMQNNSWYYYDDLTGDIIQVSWSSLIKDASKNSSILIYYPN